MVLRFSDEFFRTLYNEIKNDKFNFDFKNYNFDQFNFKPYEFNNFPVKTDNSTPTPTPPVDNSKPVKKDCEGVDCTDPTPPVKDDTKHVKLVLKTGIIPNPTDKDDNTETNPTPPVNDDVTGTTPTTPTEPAKSQESSHKSRRRGHR